MGDAMIAFTPSEAWSFLLALAAGLVTINAAIGVIEKIVQRFRKPNNDLENQVKELGRRMDDLEKRASNHEHDILRDKKRMDASDEGNRVTQQAILALLAHAIDGNNTEQLRNAKNGMEQYLINR